MKQLDTWRKVATESLDASQVENFAGRDCHYRVPFIQLRQTFVWQQQDVDLPDVASSMLVPTITSAASSSAVGDVSFHIVRTVSAISFPALCWLLRDCHTAEEIEQAWLHMPLVRPGKPAEDDGNVRKDG